MHRSRHRVNLLPSILSHVVKVDTQTRHHDASRGKYAFAQVNGFFVWLQFGTVVVVQDTVGVGRATADGKYLPLRRVPSSST
jgi:hypothetical protein